MYTILLLHQFIFFVRKHFTVSIHLLKHSEPASTCDWKPSLPSQICGPAPPSPDIITFTPCSGLQRAMREKQIATDADSWQCVNDHSYRWGHTLHLSQPYAVLVLQSQKIRFMWRGKVRMLFIINICTFAGNSNWNTDFSSSHSDKWSYSCKC